MNLFESYIVALANLYGIVPAEILKDIYNSQNDEQISIEEVNDILDNFPENLAEAFVYSYRGHFVHDAVVEFDEFDSLMSKKAGKPYYIPEKEELLKYTDDFYYEVTEEFDDLLDYVSDNLIKDRDRAQELVEEIQGSCQIGSSMKYVMDNFDHFKVDFKSIEQLNEVMKLVMELSNNTRIWENNGHTPMEIFEKFEKPNIRPLPEVPFDFSATNVIDMKTRKKIGRNDPCPCGSGKKYKKCCLGKDESN
jgi:preprotein translocase subunit SecA